MKRSKRYLTLRCSGGYFKFKNRYNFLSDVRKNEIHKAQFLEKSFKFISLNWMKLLSNTIEWLKLANSNTVTTPIPTILKKVMKVRSFFIVLNIRY